MRPRTMLLVLCFLALPALCTAQHTHQFEFGAFGSFTRYDRAFQLDNQFGGGGRLGYFFNPSIGFEFDVGYQQPSPTAGTGGPATLGLGGGSIVFNFGSAKNLLFILGGYSRLSFTNNAAYTFDDNAVHGGIGDRIFFNERTALRLEGRALYSPNTNHSGGGWAGHIVASAGLAIFTGPGAFHDADADGIDDKKDACPNTPAGATVDAKGCPSDSDHDGVYNGLDACPNTPEGAEVDQRGCPKDSDGDGVYDGIDKCPGTSTAGGVHVDATGCPIDSDHDGVPDGLDKCPNTPAGIEVDTVGCQRISDSDADGVDDSKDKCPGTAAGTRVDAAGCPILFPEPKAAVVLRGVTFEPGRSTLKPDSYTILDLVATSLVANPDIRIEIGGHTDNTGSAATNTRLSQARAEAVRAYLASKGVTPDRMVAKGYGPTVPVASNATADGRALNRRVELRKIN